MTLKSDVQTNVKILKSIGIIKKIIKTCKVTMKETKF